MINYCASEHRIYSALKPPIRAKYRPENICYYSRCKTNTEMTVGRCFNSRITPALCMGDRQRLWLQDQGYSLFEHEDNVRLLIFTRVADLCLLTFWRVTDVRLLIFWLVAHVRLLTFRNVADVSMMIFGDVANACLLIFVYVADVCVMIFGHVAHICDDNRTRIWSMTADIRKCHWCMCAVIPWKGSALWSTRCYAFDEAGSSYLT